MTVTSSSCPDDLIISISHRRSKSAIDYCAFTKGSPTRRKATMRFLEKSNRRKEQILFQRTLPIIEKHHCGRKKHHFFQESADDIKKKHHCAFLRTDDTTALFKNSADDTNMKSKITTVLFREHLWTKKRLALFQVRDKESRRTVCIWWTSRVLVRWGLYLNG